MKVLITGTSRGIGRACALKFLENGHDVIGIDIRKSSIDNDKYKHIVCDIRDNLPDIDGVEVLINNAGVQDEETAIDVNLKGTINVTKKYGLQPKIKSIVFMASASGRTGSEFSNYAASKGGVISYMKNVALEIAKYGAVSNSISAGGVTTPLNKHIMENPVLWKKVLNENLLNKWASAEEIADFAYFIAVINKSMTGEDIFIDNGEALKSNFIW